ncbi:MAG: Uma2 family endonuclease [Acidobacteriota bacterium]|nr:Uma2 family endonuclease [Acidobacteriota bacterium]
MSAVAVSKQKYTLEEYLELDKNSEERYEYFDGEVLAMAGGSANHTRLGFDVGVVFSQKLKGRNCEVFNSDMRVKVPAALPYRYPDVSVACGGAVIEDLNGQEMLVNPVLIVEVLSPSTAAYDLKDKFTAYQSIESFREYLIVSQDRPHVVQHIRQSEGRWLRIDFIGLDAEVTLESINVTLSLSEIYERVKFDVA